MKRYDLTAIILVAVSALAGCDRDMMSERGFSLPAGDPVRGQDAFLYMTCNECHSVEGLDLPSVAQPDSPQVVLGGDVTRVKTYGELVTAVINPSHKLAQGYPLDEISEDGESRMYIYNGIMTVQELIDIVAFLQPHYDVVIPPYAYRQFP